MSDTPQRETHLPALQNALLALKKSRARIEALEQARIEPIAIVGMACRFPGGANSPEEYWRLLRDGVDAIVEVPPDRWDVDAYYDPDPDAPGKMYTRWGGFLDGVDSFDPQFFGISPREAASMDPQQRLVLEVSWEAIERAGLAPERLLGSLTGVFIGISTNEYSHIRLRETDPNDVDMYVSTGNALNVAAGRLSYLLDLRGPSIAIDTACSSSLVAVHLACQSLRAGDADMAIAGGVNLILAPEVTITLSKARMMATDGRCKTFDADADGYVRGEGCGVVILKRLSDAERDGDEILALIRGSAVNQDGRSSGLTAPNGLAQQAVIRKALENARVEPGQVQYVETHGTGTSLGDPIEVQALTTVLCEGRPADAKIVLGSTKTNIGHLESAAGIAGLIKAVLALQHQQIPPHLHWKKPNPYIPWAELPIAVPSEPVPWPAGERRRIAGVSSFGFSGTNAHAVLEEAPARRAEVAAVERPLHLLTLSARSAPALHELARRYQRHLAEAPPAPLADIAHTASAGRAHMPHRLALTAATADEAREKLAAFRAGEEAGGLLSGHVERAGQPAIAFLFTGQGAQYAGMGRRLYETQPAFRRALDQCDELLRPYLERPLLEVLYPTTDERRPTTDHRRPTTDGGDLGPSSVVVGHLDQTQYTQPALFALEYALAQMWRAWGITPTAVLGHSVGEYVAACVAGVLSLEDALKLIAARGRLMQSLPPGGAMASIFADEARVAAAIGPFAGSLSIAAINGPQNIVISGAEQAVAAVSAALAAEGIRVERLAVSHAFHSPLLDPMLDAFEQVAAQVRTAPPRIDLISNVTGRRVAADALLDGRYWRRHAREPVRFAAGMETLYELGYDLFVEIGPSPILLGMGQKCLPESGALWLPSLRKSRDDWQQLLESLGALYVRGVAVDWRGFDRDYPRRRVPLPTYPFQRQRHWLDIRGDLAAERRERTSAPSALAGAPHDWLYQVRWQPQPHDAGPQQPAALGNWLIFADRGGVGRALAQLLEERGGSAALVFADELGPDAGLPDVPACRAVVHLWGLDTAPVEATTDATLRADQQRICGSALRLVQSLAAAGREPPRLWLATRGTQAIGVEVAPAAVAQAPLWGLGQVIALEHPELWGGLIDLDPHATPDEAARLLDEIARPDGESLVALRHGQRYVARLGRAPDAGGQPPHVRPDASYLITGGLGGLGLRVARWLVERGARQLVLSGRGGASEAASAAVAELQQAGARVVIARADVAQAGQVEALLAEIERDMPPLRGVVHAAGVLDDGLLLQQDWARFERVLGPKVAGAWNLHAQTQAAPLDFFVLFSSTASLLGSPGQGNYAAANAFLDALAHHRHALGLPALSINWGPWADVGMAAALGGLSERRWAAQGIELLSPEQGLQALETLLGRGAAQAAVLRVDWPAFVAALPGERAPALLADLARPDPQPAAEQRRRPIAQFVEAAPDQRQAFVQTYLQQRLGQALGMPRDEIPIDRNMMELGVDSLMIMEVIRHVKQDFELTLYPRELYERPSVGALAQYLVPELERAQGVGSPERPAHAPEPANGTRAAAVIGAHAAHRSAPSGERIPGIVFLLSSPRSGSTLLRVMLAGHSALFCPPELHLLPFDSLAQRDAELGQSYLGEGLQRALMELQGLDAGASKALLDEWAAQDLSVQQVYARLRQLAAPRLLVDKSPSYAGSPETLRRAEEIFDGARYIYLTRHPYAMIDSFVRNRVDKLVGAGDADPYLMAEQVWLQTNRNVLDFFEQVDPRRQHIIRYEDLVARPEAVAGELCAFLGLPLEQAILRPYEGRRMTDGVHSQSLGIGDPNFLTHQAIDASLGESWKRIRLPEPLGPAARQVAAALGYELPAEAALPPTLDDGITQTIPFAPAAELPAAPAREFSLTVRGLSLRVSAWGPEQGPLVLCLHGILDQGAMWEGVAARLAEQGYHVVAPDQRGHGCSEHVGPGGSYHLMDYVADVDALLKSPMLAGRPVTLVGHSMGAAVATIFGGLRPEQVGALVLIESLVPVEAGDDDAVEQLSTYLSHMAAPPHHPALADLAAAAGRLRQAIPALSEEQALRMAGRIVEPCAGGVRWKWDPLLLTRAELTFDSMAFKGSRYAELLRRIQAPAALVYGQADAQYRLKDLALLRAALPHATYVTLPGGHNLHVEAPEALAEIVAQVAAMAQERQVMPI